MKIKLYLFLTIWLCSISYAISQTNTATSSGTWSNASIWSLGHSPTASESVQIPQGFTVSIDGTCNARSITVNGVLRNISNNNLNLTTEWLLVSGTSALLEIGTSSQPYTGDALFTLIGNNDGENIMGMMGDKFIGANAGGQLLMHGMDKLSWTKLNSNASSGSNQITLLDAVNWSVNDEIVIVSSRLDWNEAEKRSINAISADQKTVTLNASLNYPHIGVTKTYTRSTDAKVWTADMRAEVGLLSHNIKIQGDASSTSSTNFGGHIMIHTNGYAYFSGVELYRMGQKTIKGRYPFHWHLLKELGSGQYFVNSSVHLSYNRAITIHGTESTLVDNNFFYDHIGHGVFLEDGTERFNTISNNVTLLSKRPQPGEEVTPSDNQFNEVQNRTPSSYWITNPNNTFLNNVAAGTEGTGFWFALPTAPMGDSATDLRFLGQEPHKEDLGLFNGNVAHSTMNGFDIFDQLDSNHAIVKNGGWLNLSPHIMQDCLWYANRMAIYSGLGNIGYTDNLIFRNNMFLDNLVGSMFASYNVIDESLFVSNSGENVFNGTRYAYNLYDGAGTVQNTHFVGWNASNANLLINTGAAIKHPNHKFSGITTDHSGFMNMGLYDFDVSQTSSNSGANSVGHPRFWSSILRDVDGSIGGLANTSIVGNHPFQLTGGEFQASNWTHIWRSTNKFANIRMLYPGFGFTSYPNVQILREKTGTPTASMFHMLSGGYKEWQSLPFIMNDSYLYTYEFESLPVTRNIQLVLEDAEVGDFVVIKYKNFGNLFLLSLSSPQMQVPQRASLTDLNNFDATGYFVEPNGDMYLKYKAVSNLQQINISWSENGTDTVNYYLSLDGNDLFDGKSTSSAWQTVEKLSSMMPSMQTGDVIHLRRGDNFMGQLEGILNSNTTNVQFTVYGAGTAPGSINN